MQPKTYTQLLEILTCMMVYTGRVYNNKDNSKEVAKCAKGLKEMAEDVQQLGNRMFNPALWRQYCAELYGDKPIAIAATELQSNAWQQIRQNMIQVAATSAVLEENCQDPDKVAHIAAHELKPLLNQCEDLLNNERPEIRGRSFLERLKERFKN